MKKSVFILTIVLLLTFMFTLTASATKPTQVSGWFTGLAPPGTDPYWFCFISDDGSIVGCTSQPVKPGLAQRGITVDLTVTIGTATLGGTCEYNLRTYDLDGIARFTMNRCTEDLAGLHLRGVGWGDPDHPKFGTWEGSYHFHP